MKKFFAGILSVFVSSLMISCRNENIATDKQVECAIPVSASLILPSIKLHLFVNKEIRDRGLYFLLENGKSLKLNCETEDIANPSSQFYCAGSDSSTFDDRYDLLKIETLPVLGSEAEEMKIVLKDETTGNIEDLNLKLNKSQKTVIVNSSTCSDSYVETTYMGIVDQPK